MTTMQDASVGIALETAYGSLTVPDRFPEFTSCSLDWSKATKQSGGLRAGRRVPAFDKRALVTAAGSGDLEFDAASKGQGLLWAFMLGQGSVNVLDDGVTYQHVFILADVMPSATVQMVLPEVGGSLDAFTYTGVVCDTVEVDAKNADILSIKASLDARDVTADADLAAPAYGLGGSLFTFAGATIATGNFQEPTATTLAVADSPLANVTDLTISVKHQQNLSRYNIGSGGRKSQPIIETTRAIECDLTCEFDSMAMAQAVLNETPLSLVATWTGQPLTTGSETLQIAIPCMVAESELPKTNAGKIITQSMKFTVLDNGTNTQPFWVVTRTTDTDL